MRLPSSPFPTNRPSGQLTVDHGDLVHVVALLAVRLDAEREQVVLHGREGDAVPVVADAAALPRGVRALEAVALPRGRRRRPHRLRGALAQQRETEEGEVSVGLAQEKHGSQPQEEKLGQVLPNS